MTSKPGKKAAIVGLEVPVRHVSREEYRKRGMRMNVERLPRSFLWIYDPSPDWVWCEECRPPASSVGARGWPMNTMLEVRRLPDRSHSIPHPEDSKELALRRLEGHREQYHTRRKSSARGRPAAKIPRPWHYVIYKRRDPKDGRKWNYGMHASLREEVWSIPEGAVEVKRGSAVSHEEVNEVFMRTGMLRKMKNRRRQARVRYPKCPSCGNHHPTQVEHYTCRVCGRFTYDLRKAPLYPESPCRFGCPMPATAEDEASLRQELRSGRAQWPRQARATAEKRYS